MDDDLHLLGDEREPAPLHRSIFFYNAVPKLGSRVELHFFEPRYRILALRAWAEEHRQRQFLFLPNFMSYGANHGDIGLLATIEQYAPLREAGERGSGAPEPTLSEAPRADVRLRFEARAVVLFHWVEALTGGLAECTCAVLPERVPRGVSSPPPFALERCLTDWLHAVSASSRYHVKGLLDHSPAHVTAIASGHAAAGAGCFAEPSQRADPTGYGGGDVRLPPATPVTAVGAPRAGWLQHEHGYSRLALFRPEPSVAHELRAKLQASLYIDSHSSAGVGAADAPHYLLHAPSRAAAVAALRQIDAVAPGVAETRSVNHDDTDDPRSDSEIHALLRPRPCPRRTRRVNSPATPRLPFF